MNKSRILVMCSIVLAMLIASIDTTIMNTTMPIIAEELGGTELYAWSFAAYMIASTIYHQLLEDFPIYSDGKSCLLLELLSF